MRTLVLVVLGLCLAVTAWAENTEPDTAAVLAAARERGEIVFLLVRDSGTRKLDEMRSVAREASRRTPGSRVVEMDRARRQNRALVRKYGVAGARLPIVLILAGNGAPAGGVALKGDALQRLLALVPTPRKADTLLALFERKAVFVVISGPGMTDEAAVLESCRRASALLKGKGKKEKAAIVRVRLDDVTEKPFLDLLGADRKATQVTTHVYGLSGKKTGVLKGAARPEAFVAEARKKAECCPGGKCG